MSLNNEESTLFSASDAQNKNLFSASPPENACKTPFAESIIEGGNHCEFNSDFPKKQHSDASDRTNNGPTIKRDSSDFGNYSPQTIDHLQAENCIHDICYPPDWDLEKARSNLSTPLPPKEPAKTYKFPLDSFQKRAINCVERNHNVLIAAHTSAGKTTIAEYAIARSIRESTRVIYTSPIKALSNQKYRDLYEEFQDVGLMTGDVTINPSASCLVMTTEILRNMLYRGSEVIREVSWVIFDEIHYMRDKYRGVVYEECLILLPNVTKFIFLSATIPNAAEFACWVAKLNRTPCNVVYTERRPVPLQHYVAPKGAPGLTLVMDEHKNFKQENLIKAMNCIKMEEFSMATRKKRKRNGEEDLFRVMKLMMARKNTPVIVFAFSRRDCETNALLMSRLDFNAEGEKTMIEQIFSNAIDSLSSIDRKLPQVSSILPLLKRGVGIHHSGLLPILKEVIEILFQEGLLKVLFATETFSMGINMPAKTVIFSSLRKFDGISTRYVSSGEYIQMSGRAGRRGIDEKGLVILLLAQKIEPEIAKKVLRGTADPLDSSFSLGYNMLLNLLRVEGSDPEYMISHSFSQFQATRKTPKLRESISQLTAEIQNISIPNEKYIKKLYNLKSEYQKLYEKMKTVRNKAENILPFLNPGRLVRVVNGDEDWGWGVVINFEKIDRSQIAHHAIATKDKTNSRLRYVADVCLHYETTPVTQKPCPLGKDSPEGSERAFKVLPCTLETLDKISTIRLYLPKNLTRSEDRETLRQSLDKVFETYCEKTLPLLDPVENMRIPGKTFDKTIMALQKAKESLVAFVDKKTPLSAPEDMEDDRGIVKEEPLAEDLERVLRGGIEFSGKWGVVLRQFEHKLDLGENLKKAKSSLEAIENNKEVKTMLRRMHRVLKKLGHITEDNVVNIKGRVACDISTADELLATELLLTGVFNDLSVEQIVALSSCLVCSERTVTSVRLKAELADPFFRLQKAAKHIALTIRAADIAVDLDEYVESFKPSLMEVAFAWCRGAKFAEVCRMTSVFEGGIIRVVRRLGELLGELVYACKIIGNDDLRAKFERGVQLIKRDIVFAASLYL